MYKNYYFLIITFLFLTTSAQEKDKHKIISKALIDYYSLQSENIHLHFNKSVYLTNETIWFKGYIIDKKRNGLNYSTTNVYVRILDKDKKEIINKLFLASSGIVVGNLKLNETYSSGTYYIHTYTNFMNNFAEDESSIFPIEIINTKDSFKLNEENSIENASIEFAAEGGKFLFDCDNTIGVQIKSCFGKGIKLNNIKVYDSKNNLINQFATNNEGFGKFEILKTKNETYKIEAEINNRKIEKNLPTVEIEGITLSVNNYSDPSKVLIKIKTNSYTLNTIKDKTHTLIIQKNNQVNLTDFNLKDNFKDLILDKSNLFNGINIIRIADENNNSIAERIIYNHNNELPYVLLDKSKISKDSLVIRGHLNNKVANFSISVLPKETVSSFENNSIISQLNFNSYLTNKLENFSYYFNDFDRKKQYELDLFFLNQTSSKYNWNTILNNKPTIRYIADLGLNIEGTLNQTLKNKDNYTINLLSIENGIYLSSKIDAQNKFEFKNIVALESTDFIISLSDTNFKNEEIKTYSKISNNKQRFLKTLSDLHPKCEIKTFTTSTTYNSDFPYLENTTILNEVELVDVKKEKLIHKNSFGNNASQQFKISKEDLGLYTDVLGFIESHGYMVSRYQGKVIITSRIKSTLGGSTSPIVYLNDFNLNDNLDQIFNLSLANVDEIYINKHGYGLGMNGANGAIKIYTKKEQNFSNQYSKSLLSSLTVKDGFQKELPFKNPEYTSTESQSFKKHGTINWIPNLYTNEDGNFEFKIATLNQEKILLNIQGIDNEGNLYYENVEIDVN